MLRDEYHYQLVILEWDGGGTRVADVSPPAHDRSRRFVRSKRDTGCPNFLNQFGSDHVLGALTGRNAIGSDNIHARGVRVVSYSMEKSRHLIGPASFLLVCRALAYCSPRTAPIWSASSAASAARGRPLLCNTTPIFLRT